MPLAYAGTGIYDSISKFRTEAQEQECLHYFILLAFIFLFVSFFASYLLTFILQLEWTVGFTNFKWKRRAVCLSHRSNWWSTRHKFTETCTNEEDKISYAVNCAQISQWIFSWALSHDVVISQTIAYYDSSKCFAQQAIKIPSLFPKITHENQKKAWRKI